MTRKEILKSEYERKHSAGGFEAVSEPYSQDWRHRPAKERMRGKIFLCGMLLALAGLCVCEYRSIMSFFSLIESESSEKPETCDGERQVMDSGEENKVTVADIKAFITPTESEIEQLYGYVVKSPFLVENLQYNDRIKNVSFAYVGTNDTVNAFAGRRVVEKEGKKLLVFHTVLCGGAARYSRLVGLAAALEDCGNPGILKKFVQMMPDGFCGRCSEEACVRFVSKCGLWGAFSDEKIRQKAISYSSGTIVSVLAHESGHHALGHLLSISRKINNEISRNQEREADSFASSVISSSPFGEYIFAGTLFWHYAIAMQADGNSDVNSDHPLSKERFENFVRANSEKAAAMGITLK